MKRRIFSALQSVDQSISGWSLRVFGEKKGLIILLFHSLFKDQSEIERRLIDPQQAITVTHFRRIIEYYLQHDFRFVAPADLVSGLPADHNHILLTFDDGYYNNVRSLPLLREYQVPAVFFVSLNHILEQKKFWWDILFKQMGHQGSQLDRQKKHLKTLRNVAIEKWIKEAFGEQSLVPESETDRPLSVEELKDFAREPFVHIGNHTADHAILTNYTADEVREQIKTCQEGLTAMIGQKPIAISYPNGNYNAAIGTIAREEGLQMGITAMTRKNILPLSLNGADEFRLGRMVPAGNDHLIRQCQSFRLDLSILGGVKNLYNQFQ